MKKETFINTCQAIDKLRLILSDGELNQDDRINLLVAFNKMADMIQRPNGIENAKKIVSFMGVMYCYFDKFGDLILLDSNKRQITIIENVDSGEEYDIYDYLENMKHPTDLYHFSFCDKIYWNVENVSLYETITQLNLFETEKPLTEIFRVGMFYLFFKY